MKADELRIGNVIEHGIVCSIYWNYKRGNIVEVMDIYGGTMSIQESNLNPIPLSEGWLSRFGLNKEIIQNKTWYVKEDYMSTNLEQIWLGNNEFLLSEMPVHRLQNIHYALYMEELTCV